MEINAVDDAEKIESTIQDDEVKRSDPSGAGYGSLMILHLKSRQWQSGFESRNGTTIVYRSNSVEKPGHGC